MAELFPTFDASSVIADITAAKEAETIYLPDFAFDFEEGEFLVDGANRVQTVDKYVAWQQWCIKQCHIERYSCLAYDGSIGIDYALIRSQKSRAAQEALLTASIKEALMVDSRTKSITEFAFTWSGDEVEIEFTATPVEGAAATLTTSVTI